MEKIPSQETENTNDNVEKFTPQPEEIETELN
jgi:hypothetical protein